MNSSAEGTTWEKILTGENIIQNIGKSPWAMHSVLSLHLLWFHLNLNNQEKSVLKIKQQILISETIQSQTELKLF